MREFPKPSIDQAKDIASKYQRRTRSKRDHAAHLYDGDFYHVGYGFSEAVRDGNCGKFLHELKKETDCFGMAGVMYLIAREDNLKPRIYLATGVRDHKEGIDPGDDAGGDHTFVVVQVRKNKFYIVDNHMGLFGRVTFKPDENLIRVYNRSKGTLVHRRYSSLNELSQDEYLGMLEKSRKRGGGRQALSTTQSVKAAGGRKSFLTFFQEASQLRNSFHLSISKCGEDNTYTNWLIADLVTRVSDAGDFDFSKGELSFYYAKSPGWTTHDTPQVPFRIDMPHVEKLWGVWQAIVSGSGRKSPVSRMHVGKLSDIIRRAGFRDDFSLSRGTRARKSVSGRDLEALAEFRTHLDASIREYISKVREDELSYRNLLRHAHYVKQTDVKRGADNLYGFLFSGEQHTEIVKKEYRAYRKRTARLFRRIMNHAAIDAKLRRGTEYQAHRDFNSRFERGNLESRAFIDMTRLRKSSFPLIFDRAADCYLFTSQLDKEKKTLTQLSEGISDTDLKRAAEWRLFDWLVETFASREALYLASFKRGLKKILDISGEAK